MCPLDCKWPLQAATEDMVEDEAGTTTGTNDALLRWWQGSLPNWDKTNSREMLMTTLVLLVMPLVQHCHCHQ